MAHRKPRGKKIRLAAACVSNRLAPLWAALRRYGPRVLHSPYLVRRMNVNARRHWRRVKLKE